MRGLGKYSKARLKPGLWVPIFCQLVESVQQV